VARCELASRTSHTFGSFEEALAISAVQRRQKIQFLTTLAIINAIIQVGGNVAAAVSGGNAPGTEQLQKTVDTLKKLMLPELEEDLTKRVEEVKKIMSQEADRGPFKVRPLDYDKGIKNRVRLRRRKDA